MTSGIFGLKYAEDTGYGLKRLFCIKKTVIVLTLVQILIQEPEI